MASVIQNVADVVNLALIRMGYDNVIGSIYEGSKAANAALAIYGQTRDEVLRGFEFGFTEREDTLTLLKQAPDGGYFPPTVWSNIYPPPPFQYEYAVPIDEIKIRTVKLPPLFLFNPDPQAQLWSLYNDKAPIITLENFAPVDFNASDFATTAVAGGPPQKTIVCNLANPICVYTAQVTPPGNWNVDFTEALAAALAKRLAPVLVGMDAAKMEASDEAISEGRAEKVQG